MLEHIDTSLIDWSRAQFALTAIYHWIFVPLTLGLAVIMGIMETMYYRTGDEFWKRTAKFLNLSSEPTGVTTAGLWATFLEHHLPSKEFWLSLWKLLLLQSCSLAGIR